MKWVTRSFSAVGALALLVAAAAGVQLLARGFSARSSPTAVEAVLARAMRRLAVNELRDARSPLQATSEVLARARAHWADHCAGCHGNDGRGETEVGRGLYPPAPDLRAAPTQRLSDGELYGIIENGIRLSGMPAWGDGTPDNEGSWELVAFIRHLPGQTAEEAEAMKALNPVSAHELAERREDDDFLGGATSEPADAGPREHDHHHGD